MLRDADLIALTLPTLCEFAWVLRRQRKISRELVAAKIRELLQSSRVAADRPAIEAGLAALDAGGDFADRVIAFEGRRLGGDIFTTFDRQAAELLAASGAAVALL